MKNTIHLFLFLSIFQTSFTQQNIESKFDLPEGFYRPYNDDFSKFLRTFPLKAENIVNYYNGNLKSNFNIYAAVFDYNIGKKNLHQCADASIYLNARFKFDNLKFEEIAYSFTNGYLFKYKDYLNGDTIKIYKDSRGYDVVKAESGPKRDNTSTTFFKYLEQLWMYAGTISVESIDTSKTNISEIRPGDLFVQGGNPGHSVTVVDVIKNNLEKVLFMLAQSYMPAQENHILLNPKTGDVWYEVDESIDFQTPEWTFFYSDLRRFN